MEDKPTLQGLPAELLEMVAEHVEPSDLYSLRLVCREIEAKVLRTFREEHFTHLGVLLYDSSSLDLAISIARHPVFGPQLQGIAIYLDVVDSNLAMSKDIHRAEQSGEIDGIDESDAPHFSGHPKDSIEPLEPPWDLWSWWEVHGYELTRVMSREEDDLGAFRQPQSATSQKLVELFKLLKGHNSLTGFAIMTCNASEKAPLPIMRRPFNPLHQLSPKSISWTKSIEIVLEALVHTDLNTIDDMVIVGEPVAIPIHSLTPRIASMLAWMFNRLKCLSVSTASEYPVEFAKYEKPQYDMFASMLRQAVSHGLADIRIRDYSKAFTAGWAGGTGLFESLKQMSMPGLRDLQITDAYIRDASDLVDFARRCSDLKRLRLRDCIVDSEPGARGNGESLRDLLKRLTKVELVEVDEETEMDFAY